MVAVNFFLHPLLINAAPYNEGKGEEYYEYYQTSRGIAVEDVSHFSISFGLKESDSKISLCLLKNSDSVMIEKSAIEGR